MSAAEVGLLLMGIGSIGEIAAVILEIKKREPIYAIMMKIFPWVFAVGAVLFSLR